MKPLIGAITGLLMHCGAIVEPTQCVTHCGMQIVGPLPNTWSCADAVEAEDKAMRMFRKYTSDPRLYSCKELRGYQVGIHQEPDGGYEVEWIDVWGRTVYGLTDCVSRQIVLGSRSPKAGSLTHEMAHALQGCVARGIDTADQAHSNWEVDGIYKAITEEKAP